MGVSLMKFKRKNFLSFVLAGALLASSCTEISAFSAHGCIQWIQSSAITLFSSKSFRRFAPVAIFTAILGTIWYANRSKKKKKSLRQEYKNEHAMGVGLDKYDDIGDSEAIREEQYDPENSSRLKKNLVEKYINISNENYLKNGKIKIAQNLCEGKELSRQGNLVVKQVTVLHQNEMGGLDSCGYQVVKNALLIVDGIESGRSDLHEGLHSTDLARQWLAPLEDHKSGGVWRNNIIVDRNKENAAKLIAQQIRKMIEDSEAKKENKSMDFHLAAIVDEIALDYAKTIVSKNDNNVPLTITADGLRKKVLSRIFALKDNPQTNKELTAKIHNGQIKFIDKPFTISSSMVVTDPQKIKREDNLFIKGDQLRLKGEKLNKDEIMRVASQQEWPKNVKWLAIDDVNKLSNPDFLVKEEREQLEELQKRITDEQENFLYVLFIATSNHSENSSGKMQEGYGHWFTMILNKQGPRHEYIVADSKNIVRFDKWVRAVLGKIEGDQAANTFACSDEECQEIRQGIEYLINKRNRTVDEVEIIATDSRLVTFVDRYKTWGNKKELPSYIEKRLLG